MKSWSKHKLHSFFQKKPAMFDHALQYWVKTFQFSNNTHIRFCDSCYSFLLFIKIYTNNHKKTSLIHWLSRFSGSVNGSDLGRSWVVNSHWKVSTVSLKTDNDTKINKPGFNMSLPWNSQPVDHYTDYRQMNRISTSGRERC